MLKLSSALLSLFLLPSVSLAQYEVRLPAGSGAPSYTYDLTYSDWGTCSTSTLSQSRVAICTRSDTQLVDAASFCGALTLSQGCVPPIPDTPSIVWTYNSSGSWSGKMPWTSYPLKITKPLSNGYYVYIKSADLAALQAGEEKDAYWQTNQSITSYGTRFYKTYNVRIRLF